MLVKLNPNYIYWQVDRGKGVSREARLILDVKISSKEHIATKGFTLSELFGCKYLLNLSIRDLKKLVWHDYVPMK